MSAGCLAALPSGGHAQNPTTDSLRARIQRLTAQVDSLRAALVRLETGRPDTAADPLARIRAAAAAAAAATDTAPAAPADDPTFVSRQRNLSALNPEISVSGDIFGFSRSDASTDDNFLAREFEISFVSNLDPFSRAKVFVAHHSGGGEIAPFGDAHGDEAAADAGHASEVEIEEGYVEWTNVASGLGVTLGKFRQRFGKLNRWHAHALPAQQYPLPILAFMGEEGLGQTGVSMRWLTPLHGVGTWEVWAEVTRSGNETLFGQSSGLSALAHVNAFWDLSPSTYFEIGLSGMAGGYETGEPAGGIAATPTSNRLFGADFTLDWRPPAQARYRQGTLHGGLMVNQRVMDDGTDVQAVGGYVIGEYKFATQWTLGGRYEYTENPDEPGEHAWLAAPSLTWWQSEYVRLRGAYEIFRGHEDRFGQLVFQATFAMGPHKHETY